MLNITKTLDGDVLTIALDGRLDTTTASQLEESVKESIEDVSSVIFDATDLKYISSAGLRVLMATQKRMGGRGSVVVRNVSDEVMEIFEVTGFVDILTVERG
ncbi:MAG: STAS domain-containing protein [Lachnospiraceae bacterium]|nr:STAS domain-containing protein [Lachnospiraceae bacterium]